jgi:RNA polymerase sigma-70 factor, ECF subfamily
MQPRQIAHQRDRYAEGRVSTPPASQGAAEDHQHSTMTRSEGDEIARAKQDPAEFAPLYERYVDAVYTYCLRRIGDPEQAADLTSRIFTRALTAMPRFNESGGSFRSWLFSIAHNTVVDTYRTTRNHASLDAEEDVGRTLAHPGHGPERIALQRDLRDAFQVAMNQLTDAQREVVALRLAGLTSPEIARAMNMKVAAVKSTQFRAYTRLRDLLAPYSDAFDSQGEE